jgi:hypothetical protein
MKRFSTLEGMKKLGIIPKNDFWCKAVITSFAAHA